ncbi:MAG: hypothetical protein O7D86_02225 [Proteobacteria bacterium]|nr:hypothetical protein [Pseudomonadota bacterium]
MPNLIEAPLASPLSGFAVLEISGNDRQSFLHNQFTNDLKLIDEPAAQLSAWCNPKGQVITTLLIINTGSTYLLIFKDNLKEVVQKRLSMFVMRSEVTINDISNELPLTGLANIDDLNLLGSNIPTKPGELQTNDDLIIICLPGYSGRYLISGNIESLKDKFNDLEDKPQITSSSIWELLDILSGIPWITANTQEQFLPQMLNLDSLKGLSYQKGCYPGQEVIARLHYKGKVKKRLNLIQSDFHLNVGDNVYSKQSKNNVGTVINSAHHPDGNFYGLAIIELDKLNDKLFPENQPDQEIIVLKLPYEFNP